MSKQTKLLADIRKLLPDLASLLDEVKMGRTQGRPDSLPWTDYTQGLRDKLTGLMRQIDEAS